MPPSLTVAVPKGFGQRQGDQRQRQLDVDHPTPGVTQYSIPIYPGPPPLEQYAPAIPVRVVSPTLSLPCANTVFLTAPLTAGGAQQLPHR
jgi:hypothetical protein